MKQLSIVFAQMVADFKHCLIYRTAAVLRMVTTAAYAFLYIGLGAVIYSQVDSLGGYTWDDYLNLVFMGELIMSTFRFMGIDGLEGLGFMVKDGDLDILLVRPAGMMTQTYFSDFNFDSLLMALIWLGALVWHNGAAILLRPGLWLGWILGTSAFWVSYALISPLAFYIDRFNWYIGALEMMADASLRPVSVYPKIVQWILRFLLPMATAFETSRYLVKSLDWRLGYLLLYTLIGGLLTRLFFYRGLRRYNSASS